MKNVSKSGNVVASTKKEIVAKVAEVLGQNAKGGDLHWNLKEVNRVLETYFQVLLQTLQIEKEVKVLEFGKAKIVATAARTAINPKTKEKILVKAKNTPKFSFSKHIKEAINTKLVG